MSEQVNLKNFKVITDKLNNYFKDNKFMVGSSAPTSGTYKVGDIVVNSGSNSVEIPMWICIEAGTPGTWEVFNSGGMNETEIQNYITNIVQTQAISAIDYTDGIDIQIDGGSIGDLNELQTSNKESVVGAINELFQNANNGKELIADAIGEPLDSSDTFSAMSNDINSLLSTFKTNMMKNGVAIESGDKFKALIDKIATLSDSEGKGLKFAEGIISNMGLSTFVNSNSSLSGTTTYEVLTNLDFTPTYIIVTNCDMKEDDANVYPSYNLVFMNGVTYQTRTSSGFYAPATEVSITDISKNKFNINLKVWFRSSGSGSCTSTLSSTNNTKWYAIGVGEEDTTLRDSLANILGDKGIEVNPEDDMATLIGKVDSINGGSLDIISASELPATGKENQICVITDNPTGKILLSMDSNVSDLNENDILIRLTSSDSYYSLNDDNIEIRLTIGNVTQNNNVLDAYVYRNGEWVDLSLGTEYMFKDGEWFESKFGKFQITSIVGSSNFEIAADGRIYVRAGYQGNMFVKSTKFVDFSPYSSLIFTIEDYKNNGGRSLIRIYDENSTQLIEQYVGGGTNTINITNINKPCTITIYATRDTSDIEYYIKEIIFKK